MVLAQSLGLSRYSRLIAGSALSGVLACGLLPAEAQTRSRKAADIRLPETCTTGAQATLDRITPEGDLQLTDGRLIRLAGIAMTGAPPRLSPGMVINLRLIGDADRWGRFPALVGEPGQATLVQQQLIAARQALVRPETGLGACLAQFQQAEAISPLPLPLLSREAGRFARLEGRVIRVREGRTAWFMTLPESDGVTTALMVQKRHLARFRLAGRDIAALANQRIRVRGTRHARSPDLMMLTEPDEIEIIGQ